MSRFASDDHRFAERVRVGVAVVTATGIVFGSAAVIGATATAAPPTSSAGQAQTAGGAPATGSGQDGAGAVSSPKGPLSPRLQEIAADKPKNAAELRSAERAAGLPKSGAGSLMRGPGVSVEVIIRVAAISDKTRAALQAAGAQITVVSADTSSYSAYVAPKNLNAVAAVTGVIAVSEVLQPWHSIDGANARHSVTAAGGPGCSPTTSLADTQMKAALARTNFGVDGTGIKIGVLSDSYDLNAQAATSAAEDVASGNLPGTGNPCGRTTPVQVIADNDPLWNRPEDEGRAMLQLVHKVAPGATLMFATGDVGGLPGFAENIRALQAAGANIIIDDLGFPDVAFQDGIVDKAVRDVTAQGVTYLAAAGNFNNGGVASIELSTFRQMPCPASVDNFGIPNTGCLNFAPTGTSNSSTAWFDINPGAGLQVEMAYSEPLYNVPSDLDIFVVNNAEDQVLASSTDSNPLTGIPMEYVAYQNTTGALRRVKVAISRSTAGATLTPRVKIFNFAGANAVEYQTSSDPMTVGPMIFGHNGGSETLSVAATSGWGAGTAAEDFSSRGPVTHYWGPFTTYDNPATAIPATVLNKPDFTATDEDCTTFMNFVNVPGTACPYAFVGTSGAVPNAAGVAALMLSRNKALTPAQVKEILIASAAPMSGGSVGSTGAGLVDANAALGLVPLPPTPTPTAITPTPTPVNQAQGPLNGCVIVPKSIPSRGKRKLQRRHCVTNAGQTVKVKVTGRLRGDTALWKVIRKKNGKVFIRTYGHRLKLRVTWKAPATGNYAAYSFTRTYRT